MPNDAKLGLVVGVGLVIAIGVVFFRSDFVTARPRADEAAAVTPPTPAPAAAPRGQYRPVKATTATQTSHGLPGRRHIVKEGETLFSLAQRYYGDGEKCVEIYRVNREVLTSPDQLPPGTELIIPDLDQSGTATDSASGS